MRFAKFLAGYQESAIFVFEAYDIPPAEYLFQS